MVVRTDFTSVRICIKNEDEGSNPDPYLIAHLSQAFYISTFIWVGVWKDNLFRVLNVPGPTDCVCVLREREREREGEMRERERERERRERERGREKEGGREKKGGREREGGKGITAYWQAMEGTHTVHEAAV